MEWTTAAAEWRLPYSASRFALRLTFIDGTCVTFLDGT
jgi:hypothetical protein